MSRIDKLIERLCPDGVEYRSLGEVCELARGVRVIKKNLAEEGDIPVFQNALKPLGFNVESNRRGEMAFVICAGAAGQVGYSKVAFWAADDCYTVESALMNDRFLYHLLLNQQHKLLSQVRKASIPRLSRAAIEKLRIPVPPMEVQEEIVRVLDTLTELEAELEAKLEAELEAHKAQHAYYRDAIFESRGNVPVFRLGDLFPFIRNGFVGTATPYFTDDSGVRYLKGTNIHNGVIGNNDYTYITRDFHEAHLRSELHVGDILVVQSGHVGECAVVTSEYEGANCHALIVMSNGGECLSQYVCHYLRSTRGKKKLASIATGGTVKHILASKVKSVEIPLPPIDEQHRIVDVLDKFDALVNDITQGLPAEIEARRKQYAYYRDRLLAFKEKKA